METFMWNHLGGNAGKCYRSCDQWTDLYAAGYGFVDHNDCNGFAAVLQKSAERGRISDAHASGSDLDACCIKNNLFSDLAFT